MKAICVTPDRRLEVRDIPAPKDPPPGNLVVRLAASAINHGDKTFLVNPSAAGVPLAAGKHDVWGASGSGTVIAVGAGVPDGYAGKNVAIYRSLGRGPDTIGLWSEKAQVPASSCLILPDDLDVRDYCGSLVNVFTAYAFLEEIAAEGPKGVIVTAGNSATGRALAALARRRHTPAVFLVRSAAARDELRGLGVQPVLATSEPGFDDELARLATALGASAVFDGVGGDLTGRIAPRLPLNSTLYFYGVLAGAAPITIPAGLIMGRNLVLRRFSNFESATAKDLEKRIAALNALQDVIGDPMFRTRIGKTFSFDGIVEAMGYETRPGAKAVLVP